MVKILVVDDEKDVETLFRQKFRKDVNRKALELIFAFSGSEALEILENSDPPDVMYIFSDINMPGMSGIELLQLIKEKYPSISVSMISAYGDKDSISKAIDFGAKEFFTKPIDFESLKEEVHQLYSTNDEN